MLVRIFGQAVVAAHVEHAIVWRGEFLQQAVGEQVSVAAPFGDKLLEGGLDGFRAEELLGGDGKCELEAEAGEAATSVELLLDQIAGDDLGVGHVHADAPERGRAIVSPVVLQALVLQGGVGVVLFDRCRDARVPKDGE